MAQEFAVNECESRCLAVSHGTVGEGVTAEEVAVSEAVVEVEGEGRVPAAVTAVLGRDPAAVTAAPAEDAPHPTNLCLDHVLGQPARQKGEEGLGPGPDQDQTRKATFLCITKISPTTHPSSLNSWHTKIWPRHIRIFYGILNQYSSFLICLPLLLVHFSS